MEDLCHSNTAGCIGIIDNSVASRIHLIISNSTSPLTADEIRQQLVAGGLKSTTKSSVNKTLYSHKDLFKMVEGTMPPKWEAVIPSIQKKASAKQLPMTILFINADNKSNICSQLESLIEKKQWPASIELRVYANLAYNGALKDKTIKQTYAGENSTSLAMECDLIECILRTPRPTVLLITGDKRLKQMATYISYARGCAIVPIETMDELYDYM